MSFILEAQVRIGLVGGTDNISMFIKDNPLLKVNLDGDSPLDGKRAIRAKELSLKMSYLEANKALASNNGSLTIGKNSELRAFVNDELKISGLQLVDHQSFKTLMVMMY